MARTRIEACKTVALLVAAALASACQGTIEDESRTAAGVHGDGASMAGIGGPTGQGPSAPVDCASRHAGARRLWRLSPMQYDNTIADLLGVVGNWGAGFPADTVVNGFSNNADALMVTPLLADKLQDAAQDIASRADLSRFVSCDLASGDDGCARDFIADLGARAFRRPLSAEDIARYDTLRRSEPDFESGLRLVVTAMLQSPHFLYRRELGSLQADRFVLDDHEIASELSYLVWQSMPDDALFTAADAGSLHTPEQISAQLTRLLESPRARPTLRAFLVEWLDLGAIATVPKDAATFPELTNELRGSLRGEVDHFIDYALWQTDGTLDTLLTAPASFVDARLAAFYGVDAAEAPAEADGFRKLDLSSQARRGILTLGGVMMRHARSNDSSPVHRGRLIRERFLCQALPPPPPGIVVQPPPLDSSKTARERYAAHSKVQPCAGCHRLMDRIGFAFEHFDGIGRYREDDHGQAIDASGEIVDSPHSDATFDGTTELSQWLAESADVRACAERQWARFAYGRDDEGENGCVIDRALADLGPNEDSLRSWIEASARSESLRFRDRGDEDDGVSAAQPASNAGPSDAGTPQADAAGTPPIRSEAQRVELIIDNDYGTGYCHTYRVTNNTKAPLVWTVALTLDGTLMQNWQSQVNGTSGEVTFSGADYNATLEPSASTEFGFCVTR